MTQKDADRNKAKCSSGRKPCVALGWKGQGERAVARWCREVTVARKDSLAAKRTFSQGQRQPEIRGQRTLTQLI